jgi:hypothetical protein
MKLRLAPEVHTHRRAVLSSLSLPISLINMAFTKVLWHLDIIRQRHQALNPATTTPPPPLSPSHVHPDPPPTQSSPPHTQFTLARSNSRTQTADGTFDSHTAGSSGATPAALAAALSSTRHGKDDSDQNCAARNAAAVHTTVVSYDQWSATQQWQNANMASRRDIQRKSRASSEDLCLVTLGAHGGWRAIVSGRWLTIPQVDLFKYLFRHREKTAGVWDPWGWSQIIRGDFRASLSPVKAQILTVTATLAPSVRCGGGAHSRADVGQLVSVETAFYAFPLLLLRRSATGYTGYVRDRHRSVDACTGWPSAEVLSPLSPWTHNTVKVSSRTQLLRCQVELVY